MMKLSLRHAVIAALSATLLAGCGVNGEMTRAEQGALIGGVAGAVLGKTTGDKDDKRALGGAVIGGLGVWRLAITWISRKRRYAKACKVLGLMCNVTMTILC